MQLIIISSITHSHSIVQESDSFLSMNNPLFYFLSLLVIGIVTYIFNLYQKKKESIYSAKKEILNRRIEIYNELYNLTAIASGITTIHVSNTYGFKIFESLEGLNNWSDDFSAFYSKNWMFFTKKTKRSIQFVRLFQHDLMETRHKFNDERTLQLSGDYFDDWTLLTDNLRDSIEDFFKNEIRLRQKFAELSDKDYDSIQQKYSELDVCKNFALIKWE